MLPSNFRPVRPSMPSSSHRSAARRARAAAIHAASRNSASRSHKPVRTPASRRAAGARPAHPAQRRQRNPRAVRKTEENKPGERQHHDTGGQLRHRQHRQIGPHIGKSFIDDQPAPGRGPGQCKVGEVGTRHRTAVRIVGIDHNERLELLPLWVRQPGNLVDLGAGVAPGRGVRAIGRCQDGDAAGANQARQRADRKARCRGPGRSRRCAGSPEQRRPLTSAARFQRASGRP